MSGTEDDPGIPGSAGAADAAGTVAAAASRPVPDSAPDPEPRPARRDGGPGRPIDDGARDRIGRGLRLHYAGVLALPIPDRLRTLLDELAAHSDTEASR
ncbi:hypothetical protein LOK46_21260 [Methylobacterium sp. NMS14P]|uniref:NepR family anti-sigma factor n=1 Tax=unclassified Methylobacterium TaxID=2615210 RepID=UPI002359760E|nr:NepR family anti-sigma factor [Methylobacterium sp. NMS14P]WCS23673.1 hypothetical protein LOK46_21260 [Methylobacterium sp. NMS14P]